MKSFSAGRYWGKRHAFEGKHTSKWCELTIKLNKAEEARTCTAQSISHIKLCPYFIADILIAGYCIAA